MNTQVKTKVSIFSVSFVCVLLAFPALSRQSPEPKANSDENIERITVYGQKSIRELNKEIQKFTQAFFKDYNAINDNNQYIVICKKQSQANTNIKRTLCEPRYVKSHRAQMIDTLAFSNDPNMLNGADLRNGEQTAPLFLSRLINLSGANRVPPAQNQKFHQHVAELMEKNPHLIEKYKKIMELQEEYAYKKANR